MLQGLARKQWLQSFNMELRTMVARCSFPSCRSRYPLLYGIAGRAEGLRVQGEWYCSEECVMQSLDGMFRRLPLSVTAETSRVEHRMPLGLLMMSRGWVSAEQVRSALDAKREHGGRVGEWLQKLHGISEEQIASAIALQWSCPVFPAKIDHECLHMVPFRLQETYAMVPVHYVAASGDLYIAFREQVDYTALYALEQMIGAHTEPCILPASTLEQALERGRERALQHEVTLDGITSPSEMARISVGYAGQIGAEHLRFVVCGPYLWLRMSGRRRTIDLLFGRKSVSTARN